MEAEDAVLLAELDRERQTALGALRRAASHIEAHIAALETPVDQRSAMTGSDITQQEAAQLSFAVVAATRHDLLLRALQGEFGPPVRVSPPTDTPTPGTPDADAPG